MSELEIHHEVEAADPLGKKIGVLAAVLAVFLGIVTIASHRAHTNAVLLKSEANDRWSLYQSKRIKFHSLELGIDLLNARLGENAVGADPDLMAKQPTCTTSHAPLFSLGIDGQRHQADRDLL